MPQNNDITIEDVLGAENPYDPTGEQERTQEMESNPLWPFGILNAFESVIADETSVAKDFGKGVGIGLGTVAFIAIGIFAGINYLKHR